jgi:hypothetical protein
MGDHDLRFAVFDLEGQLLQRVQWIEVDDCAAGFEDGIIVNDERWRIGKKEADLGALFYANSLQPSGNTIDRGSQCGVVGNLTHKADCGPGGERSRSPL